MPRPYDLRRWRRIRAGQLLDEPTCRLHREQGQLVVADQVDHITPLADGGSFDDPANLRSLCAACHSRVTRAAQTGKPAPAARTKGVDPDTGLPHDPEHWWTGRRAMHEALDRGAEVADEDWENRTNN